VTKIVGEEVTHAGSVNLQNLPATSTGCGLANKLMSKVCR